MPAVCNSESQADGPTSPCLSKDGMEQPRIQAIPLWLQALLAIASICVIALTIGLIVLLTVVAPRASEQAGDEIDHRVEEALDDLEESIASALEPTNDSIRSLDSSLGDELRDILERFDEVEERLLRIRDLLDEINLRDAEALLEARQSR